MNITHLAIPEVTLIEPDVHEDDRGRFLEVFNLEKFPRRTFFQSNVSVSKSFVVRGLHWQEPPYTQGKLVQCVRGSVFDVAVDIRPDSQTFGRWVGEYLSEHDHKQLWIPTGFAHGFQALEENTTFLYMCTSVYSKEHERSIKWDDPDIGIRWPHMDEAIVGQKDQEAKSFQTMKRKL